MAESIAVEMVAAAVAGVAVAAIAKAVLPRPFVVVVAGAIEMVVPLQEEITETETAAGTVAEVAAIDDLLPLQKTLEPKMDGKLSNRIERGAYPFCCHVD